MQAISSLRAGGFSGRLRMITDEPVLPYQRPPLSNDFLRGKLSLERMLLKPETFYAQNTCEPIIGNAAVAIDRAHRRVHLAHGTTLPYDRLLLATGSSVRRLSIPGSQLQGIHYLRSLADSERLRGELRPGTQLVVVGGGYVGASRLRQSLLPVRLASRCWRPRIV